MGYENLMQIIKEKFKLSKDFLKLTMEIKNNVCDENFENLEILVEERQSIIDKINNLDEDFSKLYKDLKKDEDFIINIQKFPEMKKYIKDINDNFRLAYDMSLELKPSLQKESENIRLEIKNLKKKSNLSKISDSYSQYSIKKLTGENFGIFIDEKK